MLSQKLKDLIAIAIPVQAKANELIAALEAAADEQAAVVAAIGASSNLTALVPAASSISAPVVAAASLSASNLTAGNAAEPTKAEVDAGIDALAAKVVTALGDKADNVDLATMRTEALAALLLKADNSDVETLRTEVEARLDAIEAKVDAVIAAFKTSGQMASA